MDYAHLSERVKTLQRELTEIAEHNPPQDRAQHQELRERLYQIRAELYGLMKKSTQRAA